jgi:hypothetical protein
MKGGSPALFYEQHGASEHLRSIACYDQCVYNNSMTPNTKRPVALALAMTTASLSLVAVLAGTHLAPATLPGIVLVPPLTPPTTPSDPTTIVGTTTPGGGSGTVDKICTQGDLRTGVMCDDSVVCDEAKRGRGKGVECSISRPCASGFTCKKTGDYFCMWRDGTMDTFNGTSCVKSEGSNRGTKSGSNRNQSGRGRSTRTTR